MRIPDGRYTSIEQVRAWAQAVVDTAPEKLSNLAKRPNGSKRGGMTHADKLRAAGYITGQAALARSLLNRLD